MSTQLNFNVWLNNSNIFPLIIVCVVFPYSNKFSLFSHYLKYLLKHACYSRGVKMMSESDNNSIDLEDTFCAYGHPTNPYLLKLSSANLSIIPKSKPNAAEIIPIDDIYGCLCMKSSPNTLPCHLTIYLYSSNRSKGASSKKSHLRRTQRIFTYSTYNEYEKNYAEIIRWHRYIKYAIYLKRNLPRKSQVFFFYRNLFIFSSLEDIVDNQRDKRALVFVNPAGGAGKAQRLVMQHVVGVWSEAEFDHHIVMTGIKLFRLK